MLCARVFRYFVRSNVFLAQNNFEKYCGAQGLCRAFSDHGNREHIFERDQREDEEDFVFAEFADQLERETEDNYAMWLLKEYQKAKDLRPGKKDPHLRPALLKQIKTLHPFIELKPGNHRPDLDEELVFTDAGFTYVIQKLQFHSDDGNSKRQHKIYGNPDPNLPVSGEQCTGCGAVLHSVETSLPGYLPSEKYASFLQVRDSNELMCQRCFLLNHHQQALDVKVSQEEYKSIVQSIKTKKGLVLFMVDMLDIPDSIFPDLIDIIGENKSILVLGNKVDLLPGDSPGYLKYLKGQLHDYCTKAGINRTGNMTDVHLLSAKTGYGVEELISKLQQSWKYKGDVYLVGATNAGKSTLFNTFLLSDYCKEKASETIKKATISPWPGTTLNLLKFPIVNPKPYRMFQRQRRLKEDFSKTEDDLSEEEQKLLKTLKKHSYVVGRVGRTSTKGQKTTQKDIEFDAEWLSFGTEDNAEHSCLSENLRKTNQFTYNELKDAHWFYDTPGIIKDGCGKRSAWFSVIASNLLPVHITSFDKADDIYKKHAGGTLLGVPTGGEERMKEFPLLFPQDIKLKGIGASRAVADIKLSTAGWIAVTAHSGEQLYLRCYTPKGATLTIRQPPLLPLIVNIKGERLRKGPAYTTKKPPCLVKNLK
ncbi:nitric oxide-associated protein 1 isoform X2 [Xenopus laevis]|uniref:Nitric oxide-associated protein 1 isoform X2 n=1 Tax=Xenopus laevis TaxID=8355 RepID=A0A8J0UTU9_XENLA|nr:nitric oxide-associated protein 1 isoform X2 [Xenopus laevis]